jgi:hypothetical protein
MPDEITAAFPQLLLAEYRIPSITAYNRLEGSPRTQDFDRSLRAEIRDPLWMLTRQWQFGEFQGEDAGSPVNAQILGNHTMMTRVGFPKGGSVSYNEATPLETVVEREPIRPGLFIAVQLGRHFAKLMKLNGVGGIMNRFVVKYPLTYAIDRNDQEGLQLLAAAKGRICDGFSLYRDMVTVDTGETETRFLVWLEGPFNGDLSSEQITHVRDAAEQTVMWFERTYSQPAGAWLSAWVPQQLEYQFAVAPPPADAHRETLVADQYFEGHLDWYAFDLDASREVPPADGEEGSDGVTENLVSFLPSPIAFNGMPNARFWAMEENQTDFGTIDTSTTGLLHLQFAEFGLIYSNDWFMLPYPLRTNTLCEIAGIVITDVFGQHCFVRSATRGAESNWQRWAMFHQTDRSGARFSSNQFYLPPSLPKCLEGDPLEEVSFLRDEMANMVWAVEAVVPSQGGKGARGDEIARRETTAPVFTPAGGAKIRYVLGTTVPDNWIPFIGVHMPGSETEIRLQRARMPGAKGAIGEILTEVRPPYFVNEEEVPRTGVTVQRSFQRARWLNGGTFLWIGRYKEAGKGEGWSNLQFDQIVDIPQE